VWTEITDPNYVQLATLVQTLRLQENESPFFANYGIPAQASIMSQIAPDAAVARTQSQFAQYFASLSVTRVASATSPTYDINAIFPDGTVIQSTLAT
jgi:hypothetical protein